MASCGQFEEHCMGLSPAQAAAQGPELDQDAVCGNVFGCMLQALLSHNFGRIIRIFSMFLLSALLPLQASSLVSVLCGELQSEQAQT